MIRTPNYVITIVHVVSAFYGYMIYTRFLFLYNDIVNEDLLTSVQFSFIDNS